MFSLIFSSDPCSLKSSTAHSIDDVIDVGANNQTNKNQTVHSSKMDVTPTIHEVEENDDLIDDDEPTKKCFRRGAVSAEPIQEEEIGNYKKKVLDQFYQFVP